MTGKQAISTALAIIGGEIALVLLTFVAQEVIFDGISYRSSTSFELFAGGLLTFLAAVLAGGFARLVSGRYQFVVPLVISIIICVETTYLISKGITGDPLWFDVLAGSALVIGIWSGFIRRKERGHQSI